MNKTWVLHIDGDGFFAYCESVRFPELRGKPVVVGVDRGIACAMTYEAKMLGITRGMPMYQIKNQFPHVARLTSHFELYGHYNRKLRDIVSPCVKDFETYSIDECFCTVSFPADITQDTLHTWLRMLKKEVQEQIGITYSFGIARTKVLAKIASKLQKPDGCTVIMPDQEHGILHTTPIETIWGIGRKLYRRLNLAGIRTAGDFVARGTAWVSASFAAPVQELWLELTGKRVFAVANSNALHKSIQSTRSFTGTSTDPAFITAEILHNLDIACTRARSYSLATNAVSIFLKTKERTYHGEHIPLPDYTMSPLDIATQIADAVQRIYKPHTKYRATGITLYNLRLTAYVQSDLFGNQSHTLEKSKVMHTVDAIRKKFGKHSIDTLGVLASTTERQKRTDERESLHPYVSGLPYPYLGDIV